MDTTLIVDQLTLMADVIAIVVLADAVPWILADVIAT